ncbi:MAG: hypothetical protein KAT17_07565, partial [Candidatus Aminicenantes bacterium]|nr:hypothetical protein [Candidatus Aminicenantes bacterium]
MRINIDYLKQFLNIEDAKIISKHLSRAQKRDVWKELFASVGLETTEIIDFKGKDIFEIEITPNRPDWLSHYGVARDLHSKLPELDFHTPNITDRKFEKNKDNFTINIENKDDCGRYIACIIRNIEVKESTEGIKELLESFGLRPINNFVDVSNLIVTTIGHPIHMFDLDKLKGNEINIRRAQKGEGIGLLDGKEIELNEDFLVIADRSNPVALAGIMGGEYSGVTQETRNILIESAYFNPAVIRKAAKKIGIKSEASFRFERGADILIPPPAINMALDMIEKSESHSLDISYYDDRFPADFVPKKIQLDKIYPSAYSGIQISENIAFKILIDLGFGLDDR